MHRWLLLAAAAALGPGAVIQQGVAAQLVTEEAAMPATLSAFGFFDGSPDRPVAALIPYELTTPLFSDFAEKQRFIYLPPGTRLTASGDGLLGFPVGAAIIKTFAFPTHAGGPRTIETRVLLHRAAGWVALPYAWRADGSDADLRIAGARTPVQMRDPQGTEQAFSYAVPNRNQCRTCHQVDGRLVPIGPQLRNLVPTPRLAAVIDGADLMNRRVALPRWDDAQQPLGPRARAYLDVNCAHCHRPGGSASNSGLFLEYERPDGAATGIFRRPVAAGRGSGGLEFDIVPGAAARSILVHRMESRDPGVAMPELGRALAHGEGVALVRRWIDAMPAGAFAPPPAQQSAQ